MKVKENKNAAQVEFFKLIKNVHSPHIPLAKRIAKVLNVGLDTAYRRIRGEYTMTFDEGITLCKHFGISLDEMLYGIGKMKYSIVPFELKGIEGNFAFAQELLEVTENIKRMAHGEIIMTAADIPAFHFIAYKELTLFQMFSWYKNVYDHPGKYEEFAEKIDAEGLMQLLWKTHNNYLNIPSSEIWTDDTMTSILKLIRYHADMKDFSDSKTPSLIYEQLFNMIEKLEEWIKRGSKGSKDIPYKFYINDLDIGNTFIYIKNKESSSCFFRLFTINGLNVKDKLFCDEVELWLNSIIKRSSLISEISLRDRFKFITAQKQKIVDFANEV